MAKIRRIVHATDFSPASRAALVKAVELARSTGAGLTVIHVVTPPIAYYGVEGYALPGAYEQMIASVLAGAQKQLDRLLARLRRSGVRANGRLLEGVVHERIVQAARSLRADLLAIGTHGRTGLARLFLGSVAARVIATARCPVLTVRGK